jgi:hypothetical protein
MTDLKKISRDASKKYYYTHRDAVNERVKARYHEKFLSKKISEYNEFLDEFEIEGSTIVERLISLVKVEQKLKKFESLLTKSIERGIEIDEGSSNELIDRFKSILS